MLMILKKKSLLVSSIQYYESGNCHLTSKKARFDDRDKERLATLGHKWLWTVYLFLMRHDAHNTHMILRQNERQASMRFESHCQYITNAPFSTLHAVLLNTSFLKYV